MQNICILLSHRWLKPEQWGRWGLSDLAPTEMLNRIFLLGSRAQLPLKSVFHETLVTCKWTTPASQINPDVSNLQSCNRRLDLNKQKTMIYVASGMQLDWTFAAQAFPYQTDNNPVLCRMVGWWLTEIQNRAEQNILGWKRNSSSINVTEVLWTRIPADAWAGGWEYTPDPSLIHTISMPLILIWTKYNFRPMAGGQVRLLLKNITQ